MYMYIINESIEIKISSNCLHVYRHHTCTSISMKNVIKIGRNLRPNFGKKALAIVQSIFQESP